MTHKKIITIILSALLLSGCFGGKKNYVNNISQYDFQDGDILLQHIPSYLCSVIADVTKSQYSHCGIVVHQNGRAYVLEAIGPVKYTPALTWINRGAYGRFTQIRPTRVNHTQIKQAIQEAETFLGRPYDIQYELDDAKIYCSELIYKAYLNGCNYTIGKKETLGSLDWQPHEKFIRYITGGNLPLKRVMVTPESLTRSPNIELVYSTFPPPKDSPVFKTDVLVGTWQGDYIIKGLTRAVAHLEFEPAVSMRETHSVKLKSGHIRMPNGPKIKISHFSASSISKSNKFKAILADSRGIKATLRAHVRDNGDRIIGTWKDNFGYTGVFSLQRNSL